MYLPPVWRPNVNGCNVVVLNVDYILNISSACEMPDSGRSAMKLARGVDAFAAASSGVHTCKYAKRRSIASHTWTGDKTCQVNTLVHLNGEGAGFGQSGAPGFGNRTIVACP
jgi:hypothetical protein